MKKLIYLSMIAFFAISCSKNNDTPLTQDALRSANEIMLNEANGFTLGYVNANGEGVIDYDMEALADVCACAIGEITVSNLAIDLNNDGDFFLTGNGTSSNSATTFAIELTTDVDGNIIWSETSAILTCKSDDPTNACTLTLNSGTDYDCNSSSTSCAKTPIGEGTAAGSPPCDWPWMVRSDKDRKGKG